MAITWAGTAWAQSTAYVLSQRVVNGGNVYKATVAGTSSGSGSGPTGTGTAITDGTVTWAYQGANSGAVTDSFPTLATPALTTAQQIAAVAFAERLVADVTVWGDLLDDGRRALAAHAGFLGRLNGTGPVTSESVGPISRGYAALTGPFAYSLTPAGIAYMQLCRTLPTVFGLVT